MENLPLSFVTIHEGVHLHNVQYTNNGNLWVPIHPDPENQGAACDMRPVMEWLARYFIFEHTPHSNPAEDIVEEDIQWIRSILK